MVKTKYFLLEDIKEETLRNFLDAVESEVDHITIVMDSGGGFTADTFGIIEVINRDPQRFDILVSEKAFSSGFLILVHATCTIKLAPGAIGMTHRHSNKVQSALLLDSNSQDYFLVDKASERTEDYDSVYLPYLTDEQKEMFNNGKDIYFTRKELQELLSKIKNEQTNNI